jgi:hypothetical protein
VHVGFPPPGSRVGGRTVYFLGRGHDHPRFVTKRVALKHRGVSIETVPDDPSVLSCWIDRNLDGDQRARATH